MKLVSEIFRPSSFVLLAVILFLTGSELGFSQSKCKLKRVEKASVAFAQKVSEGSNYRFKPDSFFVSPETKTIRLNMNASFSYLPFRPENTAGYYHTFENLLGRKFRKYTVSIVSMGKEIQDLVPNYYRGNTYPIDSSRFAGPQQNRIPLVRNNSVKNEFAKGLHAGNIALWHSHGWYYENKLDRWEWQRSRNFLTVEDLWTMSFVVPYIAPMLENAGATVFLPRERDVNRHELIIDADGSTAGAIYSETANKVYEGNAAGYGLKVPFLFEGENPFQMGKTREMHSAPVADSYIRYIPEIPETGDYSVSVSFPQSENNVTDAHYTVYHSGGKTEFLVNQTMGGGTWVYLGTFRFEKGSHPEFGRVELSNGSAESGQFVAADAVKFGGGTGKLVRGTFQDMQKLRKLRQEKGFEIDSAEWLRFSGGRPKYQEAARYFLQYSGMPDTLVYLLNSTKAEPGDSTASAVKRVGQNDYKDDYQSRSAWVNYLSSANPGSKGLGIPIDLVLGFHTDAGITPDSSIIGSLMIYDTTFDKDHFPNGQSRWASRDLADIVQTQIVDDIRLLYEPEWSHRGMWNKQYSEAARPKVPAILSELLSHQNFADMAMAQDPRFKFDVSRAFYKGILRFLAFQNQCEYIVQPLPVDHFELIQEGQNIRLNWQPVADPLEPTAVPNSYRIYTRIEDGGFDNGIDVRQNTFVFDDLKPGVIYSFKVTALNEGGESFPSEILACSLPVDNRKPVLIVNAFDRISGPAKFDNGLQAGFLGAEDEGVAYIEDVSFIGEQYNFERNSLWLDDDAPGFGASYADHENRIVRGNSFDYPFVHGKAFRNNGLGFISMSDEAFIRQNWKNQEFTAIDLIFGEEKTSRNLYGLPKKDFSLFTPEMRAAISTYASGEHARLFVTGAYVGTDLDLCGDTLARKFAAEVLHYKPMTNHASKSGAVYPVNAFRAQFTTEYHFVQQYNQHMYKVESPDAIEPSGKGASVLFRYKQDNKSAGICYDGSYKAVILGFPFETVETEAERNRLISEILNFWGL